MEPTVGGFLGWTFFSLSRYHIDLLDLVRFRDLNLCKSNVCYT